MQNRVCALFNTQYPIIQAGMIWCSGWKLASAVSNAGGLGLLGSGSMYPDVLREHIRKCKSASSGNFGVNVPLLYPDIDKHMQIILDEGVRIVFTSAGNPATWTSILKEKGITVVHVVSNTRFALKAEACGVDAVVAEGFEAGGHNGREETTTMVLVPLIREAVKIPLIAAGGIGSGQSMAAAFCLGADAVQVGSLFAASRESSAHPGFKQTIRGLNEGDTQLTLKELTPVRLIRNEFYNEIESAYARNASKEELAEILGKGRAKRGMFDGDLVNGELEIGQVSAMIREEKPAATIVNELMDGYRECITNLSKLA